MITTKTRAMMRRLRTLPKRLSSHTQVSNIYGELMVREWFYLRWAGWDYDLAPESVGDIPDWKAAELEIERLNESRAGGTDPLPYNGPPKWWPWWMENNDSDLQEMLGISWRSGRAFDHGREWNEEWRKWALTNGIAPGQLFCVAVEEPEVEKSGWETVEYDVHWSCSVVDVISMSPSVVLQRWEHDMRRTTAARAQHVALAAANADLISRDVASMYIQQSLYHPGGMMDGMPRGRMFTLHSSRRLSPCNASVIGEQGRDDNGDARVAKERLVEAVCARNPHLNPELMRKMRVIL